MIFQILTSHTTTKAMPYFYKFFHQQSRKNPYIASFYSLACLVYKTPINSPLQKSSLFLMKAQSYIEFNFHKSSLKKTLSSNSLNTHEKLKLIEQLASNLKQLHSQGFIHGNLKPSNIKLSSSKILFHDIEISWKIASALHIKNCDIEPINNVNYAAPETLDHLALTKESNIYSLGIIIWELFNHEPAFPNASTVSAKLKVVGNKPPDHGLEQITQSKLKCLASEVCY